MGHGHGARWARARGEGGHDRRNTKSRKLTLTRPGQSVSQSVISRSRPALTPPSARSPAPPLIQFPQRCRGPYNMKNSTPLPFGSTKFLNSQTGLRCRVGPAYKHSVSQLFHGPAPRSPLHRLAVRLRHSRSNTSTEYSLPGARYYLRSCFQNRRIHVRSTASARFNSTT